MAIVTRETDYALRALACLRGADERLPVSAIAERTEVPESFLRKIMQTLHRSGMVESAQGPFGGYALAVNADETSVLDVLEAVQGPLVMNECFVSEDICSRVCRCGLRERLAALQEELNERLDEMKLGTAFGEIEGTRKVSG